MDEHGLRDPDAHPVPRDHRARGRAAARRRRAGASSARSWSTTPRSPCPGCAAPRRPRPATGRRRCATRCRSTSPCRPSTPSSAHAIVAARRLPHRQGQGRRARPDRSPTTRPGSRRCATRSGRRRAGPGRRQRRLGRRRGGRRDRACWTGRPAGWSTSSSRARRVEDLAAVRRRVDVPIAADESIRRADDPYRVRDLEAADVAVLKVQPLGGVRACLRIAEDIGLPVVVSSALETSVGIAAGVALAAALPELPVRLRAGDRAAAHRRRGRRAAAARSTGRCRCAGPTVDEAALARGGRRRRTGSRTGRPGSPRSAVREDRPLVNASTALARCRGRRRWSTAGSATSCSRPGRATPPLAFAAHDAAAAGLVRLHTRIDERTAGFLALGLHQASAPRPRSSARPARPSPTCTRRCSRPPTPALPLVRRHRRPAGRGCGAPAPTRPPTRSASSGRCVRAPSRRRRRRGLGADRSAGRSGPVHLNVQLDEPLVARGPLDARTVDARPDGQPRGATPERRHLTLPVGPRTVVVAGDDAGPPARVLAEQARLAAARRADERRRGPAPTRSADLPAAARHADLGRADRAGRRLRPPHAVPAGHPAAGPRPTSRWSPPAAAGVWTEPAVPGRRAVTACRPPTARRPGLARGVARGRRDVSRAARRPARRRARPHAARGRRRGEPAPCRPSGLLFVGASNPIRDLDLMVPRYPVGDRRMVLANRGLSGIDGTVSTAIGAALGRPRSTPRASR